MTKWKIYTRLLYYSCAVMQEDPHLVIDGRWRIIYRIMRDGAGRVRRRECVAISYVAKIV